MALLVSGHFWGGIWGDFCRHLGSVSFTLLGRFHFSAFSPKTCYYPFFHFLVLVGVSLFYAFVIILMCFRKDAEELEEHVYIPPCLTWRPNSCLSGRSVFSSLSIPGILSCCSALHVGALGSVASSVYFSCLQEEATVFHVPPLIELPPVLVPHCLQGCHAVTGCASPSSPLPQMPVPPDDAYFPLSVIFLSLSWDHHIELTSCLCAHCALYSIAVWSPCPAGMHNPSSHVFKFVPVGTF